MRQGQEDCQHGEDALGIFSAPPSKAGLLSTLTLSHLPSWHHKITLSILFQDLSKHNASQLLNFCRPILLTSIPTAPLCELLLAILIFA